MSPIDSWFNNILSSQVTLNHSWTIRTGTKGVICYSPSYSGALAHFAPPFLPFVFCNLQDHKNSVTRHDPANGVRCICLARNLSYEKLRKKKATHGCYSLCKYPRFPATWNKRINKLVISHECRRAPYFGVESPQEGIVTSLSVRLLIFLNCMYVRRRNVSTQGRNTVV